MKFTLQTQNKEPCIRTSYGGMSAVQHSAKDLIQLPERTINPPIATTQPAAIAGKLAARPECQPEEYASARSGPRASAGDAKMPAAALTDRNAKL
jgi:hypothetical protein